MDTQKVELEVGMNLIDRNSKFECHLESFQNVFDPVTEGVVVIWSVKYSGGGIVRETESAILLNYYFDIL